MTLRLICLGVIIALIGLFGKTDEQVFGLENGFAAYRSPEGILFVSQSSNWDEKKLKQLYKELLLNGYGPEIYQLASVTVHHQRRKDALGIYHTGKKTIDLYNGKKNKTVESLSTTLSHEYGHHFTYTSFPDLESRHSEWGKLRDEPDYPINWNEKKGSEDHQWDPAEIIAEDYVFYYGSQNVKKATCKETYYDKCEWIIQENTYLRHPSAIKGMRELWEKQTGIQILSSTELRPASIVKAKAVRSDILRGSLTHYMPEITISIPLIDKRYQYKLYFYEEGSRQNGYAYEHLETQPYPFDYKVRPTYIFKGQEFGEHILLQVMLLDTQTRNVIHAEPFAFVNDLLNEVDQPLSNDHWVAKEDK